MDANVKLVRRLYDAFAASDFDTILAVMDPELVVTQADALPWGGEFHGYEGLATFFGRLREHITSEVTHAALYGAGDHAVQFGRTAGTVNATGAAFDIDEMHLFTIRDGRVVRFEAYIDTPAMLSALGGDG